MIGAYKSLRSDVIALIAFLTSAYAVYRQYFPPPNPATSESKSVSIRSASDRTPQAVAADAFRRAEAAVDEAIRAQNALRRLEKP